MEEFDTVLDLYDQQVSRDLEMDQYLDVCNSASLLWRLEMFGVDVGARWRPVADIALRHIEDRELMFVQLHHHMALLSAGEDDAAARLADHVRQHAGRQYDQAEAAAKAAVPLVTAMTALRAGDYDAVVEAMWPARYDLPLIGGSHAQRDFEEMLAWSAIRSRHHDLQFTGRTGGRQTAQCLGLENLCRGPQPRRRQPGRASRQRPGAADCRRLSLSQCAQ